jgi:hypothetical protein
MMHNLNQLNASIRSENIVYQSSIGVSSQSINAPGTLDYPEAAV